MIEFKCPVCGVTVKKPGTLAGESFSCTNCGEAIKIPTKPQGGNPLPVVVPNRPISLRSPQFVIVLSIVGVAILIISFRGGPPEQHRPSPPPTQAALAQRQQQEAAEREPKQEQETVEREQQPQKPELIALLSAAELHAEYEQNAIRADEKYNRKYCVVKGEIKEIGKLLLGQPYVTFQPDNCVECLFSDANEIAKLKDLSSGQNVYIAGECHGMALGIVNLRDCWIVDSK